MMLIDIYHDTACPWCKIGKQHLFDALKLRREAVSIRWHPFFLDDTIPPQGVPFRAFMQARKGIGPETLANLFSYTQQAGEASGVRLNFDKIALAVNTTLSHRLIALAPEERKTAVVEAVYRAYFEEGLDIGDINTLVRLGETAGMDAVQLRSLLSGDAALNEVTAEAALARHQGISSVPFFRINQISVNGSQSVAVFTQALDRAALLEQSKVNARL